MPTRADFYVGRGEDAEWLGSLAFDGYRIAEMKYDDASKSADNAVCFEIQRATNESYYRQKVSELLAMNDDATLPEQGWPWPWEDSRTTDYAYALDKGKVYVSIFGYSWFAAPDPEREGDSGDRTAIFPNMKERMNVTLGKRSG